MDKQITVTSPLLPNLEEFNLMLKEIWESKWITNNGQFHQQLEQNLAEYLGVPYVSLFTNGTLPLLTALQALRVTGEVITTPYSFVATTHCIWWSGCKPVFVDIDPATGNIDPDKIEAAITPKTKLLILCSPSNPTGSVYSKEELEGLANVLAKHPQVYVIADEIYEHINYIGKHESIAQFEEIRDRVVIVNGVSKAYAMTGWRIGFIAGPEWIVKGVNKLQGQYTSGPCSDSQKAAEAAYTGTQEPVEEMRKAFERRRDLIVKLAKEIPGFEVNVPQGAFYLLPKCSSYFGKSNGDRKIESAADLAMYLLEVGHVACVGGGAFGAPECIRMSYATSDENIIEAMRRIKEALALLK